MHNNLHIFWCINSFCLYKNSKFALIFLRDFFAMDFSIKWIDRLLVSSACRYVWLSDRACETSVIMKWNRQYQSPNPAYQLATEEYLTSKKLKESREQEFLKTISQGVCLLGSVFLVLTHLLVAVPAAIYLLKVNNGNTRTSCVICSKLTIKTLERCSMASFWCLYC